MQTHAGSALDDPVTLTFDLLVGISVTRFAVVDYLPTLVSIAGALVAFRTDKPTK